MRVVIVTAGSRGDVAPFTGLGRRMQDAGHHVTIAAHEAFAGFVAQFGLDHRTLPGDPVAMARQRTAAPSPQAGAAIFRDYLVELGTSLAAVAAGADVLLTPFGTASVARLVADAVGIPSMGTYLVPSVPTGAFAPPGWPDTHADDPVTNLALGRQLSARAGALDAQVLPALRERLGMAPVAHPPGPPRGWPVFHGYSPAVLPRPDDWPREVQVSGYWWPATPAGWHPPHELVRFLDAGPRPVFIGFGSMMPRPADVLGELVSEAVRRAGVRAVVQSGWAGLTASGDDIHVVGDVPHEWLLPRMAAAVHHAGAGTSGATLRAGIPSVPVPVLLDQPFWARRLHELGVAPAVLPEADLTADGLARAIRACVDDPSYARRAATLADRIDAEDGAARVLEFVEATFGVVR